MAVPAVSPQPILAPLTPAAIFLVATIGADGEATVHDALSKISGLVRAIGFRDPTKHLSVVVSIGSDAWDRLFAGPRPTELHPFVELTGPRHTAPATPGDLLFHIRAETMDVCFELAGRILKSMGDAVTVVDEVHGFRFFDNRDLLGFVDGTENPSGPIAIKATTIGDEDRNFAGSCYVHVQKYVHDMASWESLSVTEQERVIGRTKLDDIELDDNAKPANSHVALNVITDDDGTERKIVRHNMPFGEVGKLAFVEDRTIFEGYSAASIEGIRSASSNPALTLPEDPREIPDVISQALSELRLAGVDGPYSVLLSADVYTKVSETSDHGYPIREHLNRLVDGDIIWAPAIDGAFVLTTRGGDFDLQLGTDVAIGYASHDTDTVRLYLQETLTFLCYTAEASVALSH